MRIIELNELGNPADVLAVKTVPTPEVGAGQARVSVLATPIHPADLLSIAGRYGTLPPLPSVPGAEGIGRVEELGDGVTSLEVGQRVMLAGGSTWCDEIVAPAAAFIPLPDAGDAEQLSMLSVNPLTALLMLQNFVDLAPGDWIVQSASNSAVGEYVIQIAKARGLRTINIVRRESLAAQLKALGAAAVVMDGPDLAKRIKDAANGDPIRLAIDCVGGDTLTALVESMFFGATVVAYGALSGKPAAFNSPLMIFNDLRMRGFWLSKWYEAASQDDMQAALGQVIPMVVSGTIKAKVDSTFSLEQIKEAVTRAAESGRSGKVLLVPNRAEPQH